MTLPDRLLLVYFFEALHTQGFDSLEDAMVHIQTASRQRPLKSKITNDVHQPITKGQLFSVGWAYLCSTTTLIVIAKKQVETS